MGDAGPIPWKSLSEVEDRVGALRPLHAAVRLMS